MQLRNSQNSLKLLHVGWRFVVLIQSGLSLLFYNCVGIDALLKIVGDRGDCILPSYISRGLTISNL
jgi:hypothetical protein